MVGLERSQNPGVTSIRDQRVEIDGGDLSSMPDLTVLDRGDAGFRPPPDKFASTSGAPDWQLGVVERTFSVVGAAIISNPLDVAKDLRCLTALEASLIKASSSFDFLKDTFRLDLCLAVLGAFEWFEVYMHSCL